MKTIKDTKKELVKELKIIARYHSSALLIYRFCIKEYSENEIVDAFSEYLDELGFEDFKVSAFAENDKSIVCKIRLEWQEKEKDSKFKLYNSVIGISRKHGVFFCDAVKKLIDAGINERLDGWYFPIIIHLSYPDNIKYRKLKGMITELIPVHYRKDSRIQQVVHPEYHIKYIEIIVNDYLHRFI
jgi:hypothetical protein